MVQEYIIANNSDKVGSDKVYDNDSNTVLAWGVAWPCNGERMASIWLDVLFIDNSDGISSVGTILFLKLVWFPKVYFSVGFV